jgi:hypothetical protein
MLHTMWVREGANEAHSSSMFLKPDSETTPKQKPERIYPYTFNASYPPSFQAVLSKIQTRTNAVRVGEPITYHRN